MEHVALVIKRLGGEDTHCGLLYRAHDGGQLLFIHLADHFRLNVGQPEEGYYFVLPSLDSSDAKGLAAACGIVALRRPDIPYGFVPRGVSFNVTNGEVILKDDSSGVTCASFITMLLSSLGHELLVENEWPIGINDAWVKKTIDRMKENGVSSRHIRLIRATKDVAVRFRPEEVVASGSSSPWPIDYELATSAAGHLMAQLPYPDLDGSN